MINANENNRPAQLRFMGIVLAALMGSMAVSNNAAADETFNVGL